MVGPTVPSAPTVRVRSQWMPSSPAATVMLPLSRVSSCSALMPSFTGASILRVSSRIVKEASPSASVVWPDLMPFFPLAVRFRVPAPHNVTWEPSLHLMTAFSAFSFSGCSSSLFMAESLRVFTVPASARMVTAVLLAQVMAAVSALARVRPERTSVTPAVPFFTLTLPSAQLPEST